MSPTEVAALQRALSESEDRFEKLFQSSPSMIVISTLKNGRHYAVNDTWLRIMGFEREQVIGKTVWELGVWPSRQTRDDFIKALDRAGSIRDYETTFTTHHGHLIDVLISANTIVLDGESRLVIVTQDITDVKAAQTRLVEDEANRMMRLVLDAIPVRVFWKDQTLKYLGANTLFAKDGGFDDPTDLIGKDDFAMGWTDQAELYRVDDRKVIDEQIERIGYEEPQTTPDGDLIWLRTSKQPLRDADGQVIGLLGTYEDVTAQKQVEEDLRQAKEAAEQASKAKSEFLSAMSHELRTPLNAIIGFGDLLGSDPNHPMTDDQKQCLRHIVDGGDHLLNLINEILDLAKIESGQMTVTIEPTKSTKIISDCVGLIGEMARKRDVDLQTSEDFCQDGASTCVIAVDPSRFKQVMLNLLSNAVKYNRPGGKVRLTCTPQPSDVMRFSIEDNGLGIDESLHDDLFTPFHRMGHEGSDVEGSGIGLVITRKLVEMMGGEIGFTSVLGQGSTFWVDFPVAEGQEQKVVTMDDALEDQAGTNDLKTVLYVEDNPVNLTLMKKVLQRLDTVRLVSAHTAELGLEIAETDRPDLILMDINLPGMNGLQALGHLRAHPTLKTIPVLAVSAAAMQSDIDDALAAGFDDYITKPFRIDKLLETIKSYVSE